MSVLIRSEDVPVHLEISTHFPRLIELAKENPCAYIYPAYNGFDVRIVRDFCHGAEIHGRITCIPSGRARGLFWLTFYGSVTIRELCQKIEEWTEDIPNDAIMVYCREGLVYFEYPPS